MIITIDTERRLVQVTDAGAAREYPLFGADAFQILSRQWMALGWNLGHWSTFSWRGRQFLQFPDDVLRLGELFWRLRPDVIVETGVYDGGSALFFSGLCRHVISVERQLRPGVREAIFQDADAVVTLIEDDSADPRTAARVGNLIGAEDRVCVFLDSDHRAPHVRAELENFSRFVSPGCYLIVADSNLAELADTPGGDRAWASDNPGRAVDEFLASHPEFLHERPAPLYPAEFDFTELSYFPMSWLRRAG
jgi:cephalosporin hydroxylase